MFSKDYLLTDEFKLQKKKNNEVTYFMKINSTYIPLILELNQGSQVEKSKKKKSEETKKEILHYVSVSVLYQFVAFTSNLKIE